MLFSPRLGSYCWVCISTSKKLAVGPTVAPLKVKYYFFPGYFKEFFFFFAFVFSSFTVLYLGVFFIHIFPV